MKSEKLTFFPAELRCLYYRLTIPKACSSERPLFRRLGLGLGLVDLPNSGPESLYNTVAFFRVQLIE